MNFVPRAFQKHSSQSSKSNDFCQQQTIHIATLQKMGVFCIKAALCGGVDLVGVQLQSVLGTEFAKQGKFL